MLSKKLEANRAQVVKCAGSEVWTTTYSAGRWGRAAYAEAAI